MLFKYIECSSCYYFAEMDLGFLFYISRNKHTFLGSSFAKVLSIFLIRFIKYLIYKSKIITYASQSTLLPSKNTTMLYDSHRYRMSSQLSSADGQHYKKDFTVDIMRRSLLLGWIPIVMQIILMAQ